MCYSVFLFFFFTAVGATYNNCSDGELRLMGGLTDYQGRVEICINNLWGTICYSSSRYNYWDINDARVVCRNLGHQELGIIFAHSAVKFNVRKYSIDVQL